MQLAQPSSTITAAFLAGAGMTLFWQLLDWLYLTPNGLTPPAALVSGSVAFVSSVFGYFKKETVYPSAVTNP